MLCWLRAGYQEKSNKWGDGNMTANGNWSYTYDAEGRLIQAANGTTTASYSYDHQGRRIKKVIAREGRSTEAISYKYDNWAIMEETISKTTTVNGKQRTVNLLLPN